MRRLPAIYLPHGGGPWPFVELSFGPPGMWDELRAYLEGLPATLPSSPTAVVVISAHWEEAVPTVMTAAHPPLLFDYHGFPPAAYELTWPAPGAPELAAQVRALLEGAGIPSAEDPERGFDHGAFVVTKLMDPEARLPTIQLSLKQGLDPAEHLALGRALAPLRDQGVLLLGSGMSYHDLRGLMAAARGGDASVATASGAFDGWLAETMQLSGDARARRLLDWAQAPAARACHPREEHLLPLMVMAGAAPDEVASLPYRGEIMGARVSAIHFG